MSKNVLIGIVAVIFLAVVGWYFTRSKPTTTSDTSQVTATPAASESASASPSAMAAKNMVSITANGFAPNSLTIKVGGAVTWTNNDSENHTVNSDPHPTHTLYPFLNLGLIKPGESKSVNFDKAGSYTYHDHLNPSNKASIRVE